LCFICLWIVLLREDRFLIDDLRLLCRRFIIGSIELFREHNKIEGTHRPATNKSHPPVDGFAKTFERDDALWSDNQYSDVVARLHVHTFELHSGRLTFDLRTFERN
jgi:hypothetical protein